MIDPSTIQRLKELEAKATGGKWEQGKLGFPLKGRLISEGHTIADMRYKNGASDGELICELRNNARPLLALAEWSLKAREAFDRIAGMETREPNAVYDAVAMMANEAKELSHSYPSLP